MADYTAVPGHMVEQVLNHGSLYTDAHTLNHGDGSSGGSEPVTPKRYVRKSGVWVPIQ